jgi:predicted Rdx family selenoprotein
MIFDSNLKFAVDLNSLNLEFCIGAVYEGIILGYEFVQRKVSTGYKKARDKQRQRRTQQPDEHLNENKRKRSRGRSKEARKRRQE